MARSSAGAADGRRRDAAATRVVPAVGRPRRRAAAANPLWAWFTGGNALTRIGVIALFFGVAFLLKYFAEIITMPIELKLARRRDRRARCSSRSACGSRATRPGYGLSLEGAGAGILYLTTFAAFRLYDVLPAGARVRAAGRRSPR